MSYKYSNRNEIPNEADELLNMIDPANNKTFLSKEKKHCQRIRQSGTILPNMFILWLYVLEVLLTIMFVFGAFGILKDLVNPGTLIFGIISRLFLIVAPLFTWRLSYMISNDYAALNKKYRTLKFSLFLSLVNLFSLLLLVSFRILIWYIPQDIGFFHFDLDTIFKIRLILALIFSAILAAIPGNLIISNLIPTGKLRLYSDTH